MSKLSVAPAPTPERRIPLEVAEDLDHFPGHLLLMDRPQGASSSRSGCARRGIGWTPMLRPCSRRRRLG